MTAGGGAGILLPAMTPDDGLRLLREGNDRFAARGSIRLAGQSPFGAVLSCMDSRVPVETIFDLTIGNVFSLRIAGNVVDEDVLGSLEYATQVIGAKLVLVLGHTHCGAVQAAIDQVTLGHLTGLLEKIAPAVAASGPGSTKDDAYVTRVVEENVRHSIRALRERSPIIGGLASSGAIEIRGAVYDLESGRVTFLAPENGPP